jgi:hypothetical protein
MPDEADYLVEDHLDVRPTIAAFDGLFASPKDQADHPYWEAEIVRQLAGGARVRLQPDDDAATPAGNRDSNAETAQRSSLTAFRDFGLFIYRNQNVYCALRCGHVGQNGNGGHAHNDQLSFEACFGGTPFVVDPGTYVYTPYPDERNRFRSTAMHNTLSLPGKEQNRWLPGRRGLFRLYDQSKAQVVELSDSRFVGEHTGFGAIHRRAIDIASDAILGRDECEVDGTKEIHFHLDPDVRAHVEGGKVFLVSGEITVWLTVASTSDLEIRPSNYSPGYGWLQESQQVVLVSGNPIVEWRLEMASEDVGLRS